MDNKERIIFEKVFMVFGSLMNGRKEETIDELWQRAKTQARDAYEDCESHSQAAKPVLKELNIQPPATALAESMLNEAKVKTATPLRKPTLKIYKK